MKLILRCRKWFKEIAWVSTVGIAEVVFGSLDCFHPRNDSPKNSAAFPESGATVGPKRHFASWGVSMQIRRIDSAAKASVCY